MTQTTLTLNRLSLLPALLLCLLLLPVFSNAQQGTNLVGTWPSRGPRRRVWSRLLRYWFWMVTLTSPTTNVRRGDSLHACCGSRSLRRRLAIKTCCNIIEGTSHSHRTGRAIKLIFIF